MAKVKLKRNLDALVARRIMTRHVDDVAREVERRARDGAPPTKTWMTMGDERVRDEHVGALFQERPDNLRFSLKSRDWDMGIGRGPEHGGANIVGPTTFFLHPGHGENESIGYTNAIHCRCSVLMNPTGLSQHLRRSDARAEGTKVSAKVSIRAPGVIGAELGDAYYLGSNMGTRVEPGTHFMQKAARDTARSRVSR